MSEPKEYALTLIEADGIKWFKRAVKERRLYFTKADKGGCMMILDTKDVDTLMNETLQDTHKFRKRDDDPRNEIKTTIKTALCAYVDEDLISMEDLFSITSIAAKG